MTSATTSLVWKALGGRSDGLAHLRESGEGDPPSCFAVGDLAAASIGAAALAIAELIATRGGAWPEARVDRRLAALWFGRAIVPQGWEMSPGWEPLAGDYETRDGWIRLHTNAPHHRAAALAVLGAAPDREAVARAVRMRDGAELETAIVAAGGCAATMRSEVDWAAHPQGAAVAAEPLLDLEPLEEGAGTGWQPEPARPLRGVRVLDLTRVLAGPVATRYLAGFGAEVLRVDPPDWEEPGVVPDVALGKSCCRLDLRGRDGRARLEDLVRRADVLVHGYRPGALAGLGFRAARLRALRPGLIDVSLDAYGWTGPWAERRGFDSLVQMSSGIAETGMRRAGAARPVPLPVQALDHATGYLMAAAAIRALSRRLATGEGTRARASLARTAALLTSMPVREPAAAFAPIGPADLSAEVEATSWGPALRPRAPCDVAGAEMRWDLPARNLGTAEARWRG